MNLLDSLDPHPSDLVVVPMHMEVSSDVPFMIHKMKFLHNPSIIRSGASSMNLFEFTNKHISNWLNKGQMSAKVISAEKGIITELSPEFSDIVFERMSSLEPRSGLDGSHIIQTPESTTKLVPVTPEVELSTFYRYSRGVQTINRLGGPSFTVAPKGGVAFYIELDAANNCFAFSYALCHTEDNFCRKIARSISKQRFDSGDWYEIENYNPELAMLTNIKVAIWNLLYGQECDKLQFDMTNIRFSSMSERTNEHDLKQIFERI